MQLLIPPSSRPHAAIRLGDLYVLKTYDYITQRQPTIIVPEMSIKTTFLPYIIILYQELLSIFTPIAI